MQDQFKSLKDHVYDFISNEIDSGALGANDRISEQSVCDAIGVSRTPVREALIQLAGDGYLSNEPRKGFRVIGFNASLAEDIFEIMGALDGQAAYLSCDKLTDDDLAQMKFLISAMDLAISSKLIKNYDDLQKNFHDLYQSKCDNEHLLELIDQQERHFLKKAYSLVDDDVAIELLHRANKEHAHILELFEQKNKVELRNYVCDVHWSTDNAHLAVWE